MRETSYEAPSFPVQESVPARLAAFHRRAGSLERMGDPRVLCDCHPL